MSMIPEEEVVDVLDELAKITSASQFLNGVQNNPELVFEAVKTLAEQSIGEGTTIWKIHRHQTPRSKKFALALDRLQLFSHKSATITSTAIFNRD
ncbi:hypothetical protein HI914_04159 [Erysiphe necator]|nr:hypothetical protein HI914_04159 [Erysiphe necator]